MPRHPDTVITPNVLLSDARKRLPSLQRAGQCMSRAELADAVNAALDRLYPGSDLTAHYVDFRWIGKLERGEHRWPSDERRTALRLVLGVVADADLGLYSPRRTEPVRPNDGTDALLAQLTDALTHSSSLPTLSLMESATAELDATYAQSSAEEALRNINRLLGPVVQQLRRPQPVDGRRRLCALAGRLAGLKAWSYFDQADNVRAEAGFILAVGAASEAEDASLGGWLLGAHSLIPSQRGYHPQALTLIDRGVALADDGGADPAVRAWLYALRSRALAGMADASGSHEAYRIAESLALQSSQFDRRHGMDFTSGILNLDYYAGTSWLLLNAFTNAEQALRTALAGLPKSHRKAAAVLTLHLGDVAARQGHLDKAVALTTHALVDTGDQPIMPIMLRAAAVRRMVDRLDQAELATVDHHLARYRSAMTTTKAGEPS